MENGRLRCISSALIADKCGWFYCFFECVLLPFAILLGMRIAMNTFSRGLGIQNRLGLSPLIKQCIYTWQDNQDVFSIPSLRCVKCVKLFNPIRIVDVTFTEGFQGSSLCEFQPWTMEHYPFVDGWRMNSMARGFPKMRVPPNHQLNRNFHYKPSSYGGSPIYGTPHNSWITRQ